jgi:cysteine-rich repeat protein
MDASSDSSGPDVVDLPVEDSAGWDATSDTDVQAAACGDSHQQPDEQCDDGNTVDDDSCTNDCTFPRCGDGITQLGEDCDDGNDRADDRCTPDCKWVPFKALVAGSSHVCGLRTNGMVTCWGEPDRLCTPPPGTFKEIAAGDFASCGIRLDGTLECWGTTIVPPKGAFDQLAVGEDFACAIDSGGSMACWGDGAPLALPAPVGKFYRVAAAGKSACALTTARYVVCWGEERDTPPTSAFVDLAMGKRGACGLDSQGAVTCWGGLATPPGRFRSVFVGANFACGALTTGTATCWGGTLDGSPPAGGYNQVVATSKMACGLLQDGTVACWGGLTATSEISPTAPPARRIVVGHEGGACVLRRDGVPRCATHSLAVPPLPGAFESVAPGRTLSCGLRTGGAIECWGVSVGASKAPSGLFRQVVVGDELGCVLDGEGQPSCWGERSTQSTYGPIPAPPGPLSGLAAAGSIICGVQRDGRLACVSSDELWLPHPTPAGSFVTVAVGPSAACGLRADGTSACWGPRGLPDGPAGLKQIGVSQTRGFGLTTAGEIASWGGGPEPVFQPQGPFRSLSVGAFACGVRRNGQIVCLGGQVVNGDSPR